MSANPATGASPYANPTLKCDIVMKGGITSGVIYPRAVAELAKTYRLTQVGGASAGAIAAVAAAAAELGRGSGGFEELDAMPDALAAVGPDGHSTLASFFQPTRTAAPLFRLMFSMAAAENKMATLIGGLLRSFWKEAVVGALVGLVIIVLSALGEGIAAWAGVVGGGVALLLGVALGVVAGALRTFAKVAEDNFGMCTGMEGVDAGGATPLTPWLHAKIQSLAGRADGPPLTFGDLSRAGVTLRVMTTNLSRHQPMAMPWSTGAFYFDPDEMRRLFPDDVVRWMVEHPPETGVAPAESFKTALSRAQAGKLRPWPSADDLPVIVATRMSLSFPGLISAVRLWSVDFTDRENWRVSDLADQWRRDNPTGTVADAVAALPAPTYSSVWFTDGGLCANLPVHFFDSALPRHPTFAFNLAPFPKGQEKSADEASNSYLPTGNAAGIQRSWFALPTKGLGAWGAFGLLMVHTAREWVDAAQMVMPGYRDRIVTVYQDAAEGGMNLSMPAQVVKDLAVRGKLGAVKLVDTFAGDRPGVAPAHGWDNHRWIRLRTSTSGLARWLQQWGRSYHDTSSGGTAYARFAGPGADAALPSYRLTAEQRDQLNQRTGELTDLVEDWGDGAVLTASAPKPTPQLRLVPDDGTATGLDAHDPPPTI